MMFSHFFRQLFKRKMTSVPQPLVVVLGATGTGKSKLAIEIAQKFNGEILSADSMQVYKGLDIITNKVTAEERSLVKHHLLDFVDPLEDFNIHHFRDQALQVIKELHSAGKLPVVVGGTHYYIESVLWQVLIARGDSASQPHGGGVPFAYQPVSESSAVDCRNGGNVACKPSDIELGIKDSVACKPSDVGLRNEGSVACKPSAVELRSEGSVACKPSVLELRSEGSVACKPSAVELRSEGSVACKPSVLELRSEGSVACKPSVLELRSEGSVACKPSAVELRSDHRVACKPSDEVLNSSALPSEQPNSENIAGCDIEIKYLQRDNAPLSVESNKVGYTAACHRYDAGSGANAKINETQCSNDGASSSPRMEKSGTGVGGDYLVASSPDDQRVAERTYKRYMTQLTHTLYEDLRRVDPNRAKSLHPNNRRKIIRSLEVWQNTGLQHSEHLMCQRAAEGGSVLGGGLRYSNTVVLWVSSDQEVLEARLDARVDDMLEKGLVAELLDFHDRYNKSRLKMTLSGPKRERGQTPVPPLEVAPNPGENCAAVNATSKRCREADVLASQEKKIKLIENTRTAVATASSQSDSVEGRNETSNSFHDCIDTFAVSRASENIPISEMKPIADYTLGIFQSIGFKEFHDYLVLSAEERESNKGMTLYKNGVERLKLVTRRYARRQVKWIRSRFTGALARQVPPMYRLDATDPRLWQTAVHSPAVTVVGALLRGEAPPSSISRVSAPPTTPQDIAGRSSRHECSVCERVFIGDHQWQAHLASNTHKRCKRKKKLSEVQSQTATAS